jgi:hypothetical protein
MKNRNRHHQAIVAKLQRSASAFEVRMVDTGLSEEEAFALERERIALWRSIGSDLTNMTSGGQGISGLRHSEETKRRLSEINKGMPAPFKGKKHSERTKAVLSELGKKRGAPKLTEDQKEKAADWHRGRKRSAETCAKISEKAKGRPAYNKGKPSPLLGRRVSEEVIKKMSAAAKLRWAKKKAEAQS